MSLFDFLSSISLIFKALLSQFSCIPLQGSAYLHNFWFVLCKFEVIYENKRNAA